jgi:predicted Zn finger-like uncharacterized protein
MRFVCDQCQTRYTIPDDKARGRALKVRCKKCGNVIVIKPLAAEPQAPAPETADATMVASPQDIARLRQELRQSMGPKTAAAPPPPAPPPPSAPPAIAADGVEWFTIIKGQQEGPLTKAELVGRITSGGLAARNYVWSEELPDWKRLEDVPTLAVWLSEPTQHVIAPAPRRPAPAPVLAKAKPEPAAEPIRPRSDPDVRAMFDVPIDDAGEGIFKGDTAEAGVLSEAEPLPTAAEIDPFANVPDSPDMVHPKQGSMGEMTRFVIAQSGIDEGRSPWRIAIFVGAGLIVVGGVLFGLTRVGVNLPGVHPHAKTDAKVFNDTTAAKDPSLRNELLGVRKEPPKTPGGTAPASHGPGPTPNPKDLGPLAHKEVQHVDQLDEAKRQQLKNLYQSSKDPSVKVATQAQAPAIDRPDAPLTAQQVASTVAHFQSGYGRCVDMELKRNPGFHGGKIKIVTTIMSSGLVRQAEIRSEDTALARRLSGSPLGGCLVDNTRRMVFPNFSGDAFDAEIPLVLSSSL